MKRNVLIFCSWLNLDSNVGIFFIEQAELIKPEYRPILVVFKKIQLSKTNFFNRCFVKINERKTDNNIIVLEIVYPHIIELPTKINKYFEKAAIIKLELFLKERNISIAFIHAQSLFDAGIWAYKYFKSHGSPYIITEHNQLSFRNISKGKTTEAINALNYAKKILVVSNDKIRQFAANGLFYDFINIGNHISNKFKTNYSKSDSIELRLITIGAYTAIKDQTTILEALKIVDNAIINSIIFTWVGIDGWGGTNENKVLEIIKAYNFKNIKIIVKPLLNRAEVAKELKDSDLFVFSSLSEGMPISVLEALACGVPVFTSYCGGVDEIINDNNGRLYPIKNFEILSDLILDFINKNILFDKTEISYNILEKFGHVAFKKNLLSVYNSIK